MEKERCELYLSQKSVEELLRRLSRIEGQIKGIRRMIREKRSCDEILIQISAVKSALSGLALKLLKEHIDSCVKPGVESGDMKALEEFLEAVKEIMRRC